MARRGFLLVGDGGRQATGVGSAPTADSGARGMMLAAVMQAEGGHAEFGALGDPVLWCWHCASEAVSVRE